MTTIPEVKSAIEEARTTIAGARQAVVEQKEADKQFARMFSDCAALLENTPESRVRGSLVLALATKTIALLPLFSRYRGIPTADLADRRRLTRSLNGTGEPIRIILNCEVAVPSKTGSLIELQIQDLAETLWLGATHAEIYDSRLPMYPYSGSFIRRANITDVPRFQPVVDELIKPHA